MFGPKADVSCDGAVNISISRKTILESDNTLSRWREKGFAHFVFFRFALCLGTVMLCGTFFGEYLWGTAFDSWLVVKISLRSYLTAIFAGMIFWKLTRPK